jgi:hypothetical protein
MEKKEFDEMIAINKALGGKFDMALSEVTARLNMDFIGFRNFKKEFKDSLATWNEQINSDILDDLDSNEYGDAGIDDTKLIQKQILDRFSKNNWKYLKAMGNKLAKAVTPNITYNKLKKVWKDLINNKITNIENLDKKSDDTGHGERWKLTVKKIEELAKINFSKMISKNMLNKKDVLKIDHLDTFKEKVQKWCTDTKQELSATVKNYGTRKVIQNKLSNHDEDITSDGKGIVLQDKIITCINSSVTASPITIDALVKIIKSEIKAIHEFSYIKDLFNSVIENSVDVSNFNGPEGIGLYLFHSSEKSLSKEILLSYYITGIQKWKDLVMGGPNNFLTGLKQPEKYILDTTKLKNSFSLIFNTPFGKANTKPGDFIFNIILGYINDTKISLQEFDKLWQDTILASDLANSMLNPEFESLYKALEEAEWQDLNLPLILPQESEIIFALKQSRYYTPKKKEEEEPLPPPPPVPKPRKNPIVTFKNLDQKGFSIVLSSADGKKITDWDYTQSPPNLDFLDISDDCRTGNEYQIHLSYSDGSKTGTEEVIIADANEHLIVLFSYKNATQQIFSYTVPFMPTKVEVYGGNGSLIQTTTDFRAANDFAFECLSRSVLKLNNSAFSAAMDFYLKFIGDESTTDYWCSSTEYKTSNIEVLMTFKVSKGVFPILVDFVGEPWDAFISSTKSEKDIIKKTLTVLKGKNKFLIGKGIHGQAPAFLMVRDNDKKIVVKKSVYKPYSTDQWQVYLNVKNDTNLSIDYDILELIARNKLVEWVTDVLFALANELNKKIDKKTATEVSYGSLFEKVLKSLVSGLSVLGPQGVAASVGLQIFISILSEVMRGGDWNPSSKEELINIFKVDIIDRFKRKFENDLGDVITRLVRENPDVNTTEGIKNILIQDMKSNLPKPTELVKQIDWNI